MAVIHRDRTVRHIGIDQQRLSFRENQRLLIYLIPYSPAAHHYGFDVLMPVTGHAAALKAKEIVVIDRHGKRRRAMRAQLF